MRRFAIVAIFVIFSYNLYAQNIIPRFDNIGVNDGLSQSSVYSIYQDKKGFMWFGTADGLNRYDGQNIRVYKIDDKKIANSNFIHGNICEDSHGDIWFCNETGLYYYDPLTDRLNRKITFNKYRWTAGIFIDDKDVFYILSPSSGIYAYRINTNQLISTECLFKTPYDTFTAGGLTTNFKNAIWVKAPGNDGMILLDTRTGKVTLYKTPYKFHSAFYANGKLYSLQVPGIITVTDTAFHILDTLKYTLPKKKALIVQALYRDHYHRLWISTTDNGLISYNENRRSFTNYLHDNAKQKSLPINLLSALCIDRSGNLWVGTDGSGVCKLDLKPPKFNLFPLSEGDYTFLKDYFIKCFYEDEQG
ncbi:MAG: two-component regulator propeller domain-containing protein, partial [Sphingobacteriales bacterium]